MKAKLIKVDKGYYNLEDEKGNILGTSYQFNSSVGDVLKYKLSKQNCDELFGVVDVEKLALDEARKLNDDGRWFPPSEEIMNDIIFDESKLIAHGFNKAMELNKDKVFTLEDMFKAIELARKFKFGRDEMDYTTVNFTETNIIQSLQQPTEIEVDIEMEDVMYTANMPKEKEQRPPQRPKLDSEGCLILKKK
jgi:hypothetical protein